MNFDFFNELSDKYLQTNFGRGIFLAGIVLGMIANEESKNGGKSVEDTPLYKQINFGKMTLKELKKHLARTPELMKAYNIEHSEMIKSLMIEAGELILKDKAKDLGVDGNFAFTVAFMNSREYFWSKIFKKKEEQ